MEFKTISLADRVFDTLEARILNGTYAVGEIISEKRLSEDLGVSRTPIREALNRLTEEDLIEEAPNGTVVVGMTDEDMMDIYDVKERVETIAVRRAAENITEEQIAKMKEYVDEQEFYAQKQDYGKIRDLDTAFHDVIYDACESRVLARVLRPIHHKIMRYRKASLEVNHERTASSISEHGRIADALAAHDPDRAEKEMSAHIHNAYRSVLEASNKKKA